MQSISEPNIFCFCSWSQRCWSLSEWYGPLGKPGSLVHYRSAQRPMRQTFVSTLTPIQFLLASSVNVKSMHLKCGRKPKYPQRKSTRVQGKHANSTLKSPSLEANCCWATVLTSRIAAQPTHKIKSVLEDNMCFTHMCFRDCMLSLFVYNVMLNPNRVKKS